MTATPEPVDIYTYTPRQQAARDIQSALRGIRAQSEAPRIIQSMVLRHIPENDDAMPETWFEHASRPHQLPATCRVRFLTHESGAVFVDAVGMVDELAAEIEAIRLVLNPLPVATDAIEEMAA